MESGSREMSHVMNNNAPAVAKGDYDDDDDDYE